MYSVSWRLQYVKSFFCKKCRVYNGLHVASYTQFFAHYWLRPYVRPSGGRPRGGETAPTRGCKTVKTRIACGWRRHSLVKSGAPAGLFSQGRRLFICFAPGPRKHDGFLWFCFSHAFLLKAVLVVFFVSLLFPSIVFLETVDLLRLCVGMLCILVPLALARNIFSQILQIFSMSRLLLLVYICLRPFLLCGYCSSLLRLFCCVLCSGGRMIRIWVCPMRVSSSLGRLLLRGLLLLLRNRHGI